MVSKKKNCEINKDLMRVIELLKLDGKFKKIKQKLKMEKKKNFRKGKFSIDESNSLYTKLSKFMYLICVTVKIKFLTIFN